MKGLSLGDTSYSLEVEKNNYEVKYILIIACIFFSDTHRLSCKVQVTSCFTEHSSSQGLEDGGPHPARILETPGYCLSEREDGRELTGQFNSSSSRADTAWKCVLSVPSSGQSLHEL